MAAGFLTGQSQCLVGQLIVSIAVGASAGREHQREDQRVSAFCRSARPDRQHFGTKQYVVPANSNISFTVDSGFMFTLPRPDRLTVDSHYEVLGSRGRGPIKVESFEGIEVRPITEQYRIHGSQHGAEHAHTANQRLGGHYLQHIESLHIRIQAV